MKNKLFIAPCLFLVITINAQTGDVFNVILDSLKQWRVPGASILIAKDGKILAEKFYGYSNLENKVPAKAVTKYEMASITKPITATAVMILVEQGKVALDSSIAAYLDGVPDSHKNITIRQLMSHTSGLPTDHYDFMKLSALSPLRYTAKDQLKDLFSKKPESAPGTKYNYSNGAFFLLAAIIEKISGQRYQQFIRKNIFEKAGMENSYFINGDSIVNDRAQGYTLRGSTLVRFSLEQTIQSLDANGFGSVISSTGDMMRFAFALTDGKIIKKESLEQMMKPTLLVDGNETGPPGRSRIGLGWFARNIENKKTISHSGHMGTAMVYFPNEKFLVLLFANLGQGYPGIDHGFKTSDAGFLLAEIAAKKYLKN